MGIKYHHLLQKNADFGSQMELNYRVAALSNTTINQCKEIIEYSLRCEGVGAVVEVGEYDNIIQDSERFSSYDCVIIFWEAANLVEDLPFRFYEFDQAGRVDLVTHVKNQIKFAFEKLESAKLVLFNRFSAAPFTLGSRKKNELDLMCDQLNDYVARHAPSCVRQVDIERIYFARTIEASIDLRYFLSSMALYSVDFYRTFAEYIKPFVLSSTGKIKKALIFDCDNTLWKGILAEDGLSSIKMYKEIQHMAVEMAKKGVIIGLCSKNNPEDVDEALRNHSDLVLTDQYIVIKAVNWEDKSSNLQRIATSLNIGLDSIVFVDDSDFEVNLIKEKLPEVAVVQVPKDYAGYVNKLRSSIDKYFYKPTETEEDVAKIKQYKTELVRVSEKDNFENIEDYLKALHLKLKIYIDPLDMIDRLSQLTQKTNQFNLTTRRYTSNEIKAFIEDPTCLVVAMDVTDKFGAYGTTGLAICHWQDDEAKIDSLIMSCRILGRNIEFKLVDQLLKLLKNKNVEKVSAEYINTAKNSQVSDLYLKVGFSLVVEETEGKLFERNIVEFNEQNLNYIKVSYA
jgi:FkbH-like protein